MIFIYPTVDEALRGSVAYPDFIAADLSVALLEQHGGEAWWFCDHPGCDASAQIDRENPVQPEGWGRDDYSKGILEGTAQFCPEHIDAIKEKITVVDEAGRRVEVALPLSEVRRIAAEDRDRREQVAAERAAARADAKKAAKAGPAE